MKFLKLFFILFSLTLLTGCSGQKNNDLNSEIFTGKLYANLDFIESSGYYEGIITLDNNGNLLTIITCTNTLDWIEEGKCYEFNQSEGYDNIDSHKYSAELSGCYVGELKQVNC